MTAPIEQSPGAEQAEDRSTAFGLALRIDPRISIPGLGQSPDSVAVAAGPDPNQDQDQDRAQGRDRSSPDRESHVRLDDDGELDRRWQALTAPPLRARELRFEETLLLSVDFAVPAGYLLWTRDFGRVLISPDGLELLCEPNPANEDWASILAAQALPLAATIRGLEVFHASGVVLEDRALLFAGPPGAGKSSLAAALLSAGGRLLSDDAVALQLSDGRLVAHAGSVVLQLRDAEDERLSTDARTALGGSMGGAFGKRRYVSPSVPEPVPVGGLFLLQRSTEEPALEQLAAVDPFELIASTFNLSVRTPARLQRQLDVVSAVASNGLAHRLRVQPDIDATRLASIVRAQFAVMSV
jgi:hypothetical protein